MDSQTSSATLTQVVLRLCSNNNLLASSTSSHETAITIHNAKSSSHDDATTTTEISAISAALSAMFCGLTNDNFFKPKAHANEQKTQWMTMLSCELLLSILKSPQVILARFFTHRFDSRVPHVPQQSSLHCHRVRNSNSIDGIAIPLRHLKSRINRVHFTQSANRFTS